MHFLKLQSHYAVYPTSKRSLRLKDKVDVMAGSYYNH